jgi:RimJ/RimL family protein N-acetyltransferase
VGSDASFSEAALLALALRTARRSGDYAPRLIQHAVGSRELATRVIGWTLHPDHVGNGYMTEAAGAVLKLAFRELGLHRVSAELDPRNRSSAALCERLAMGQEAVFREDLWFKGEWGDTAVFAIIDRDWSSAGRGRAS